MYYKLISVDDTVKTYVHGFGNNFFVIFNDTYRMSWPMIIFRGRKIDEKFKHLSVDFPCMLLVIV
jgi:hypothetical protein